MDSTRTNIPNIHQHHQQNTGAMCLAFLRSQYTVTRLHHVSGVIIPKQYINSLSYHHRWINWMNQHYSNSPNLKTPSSYSDLMSELRFGDNVWCRNSNGSDPRHVQGCQDGSTGLESQVPRQKCHPPVDTRPGVDMDPDGSGGGGKLNPFQLAILQPRQQPAPRMAPRMLSQSSAPCQHLWHQLTTSIGAT